MGVVLSGGRNGPHFGEVEVSALPIKVHSISVLVKSRDDSKALATPATAQSLQPLPIGAGSYMVFDN